MITKELTIGGLAERADVNVETIRFYHRRGLLDEPVKPLQGFRHYPSQAVQRVRFIQRAQRLGFTLKEVEGLLLLEERQSCRETRLLAEHKLQMIEQRIDDLARMQSLLRELIQQCKAGKRPRQCPIMQTLSEPA